jgi:DNA-binding response OmpR family regulator
MPNVMIIANERENLRKLQSGFADRGFSCSVVSNKETAIENMGKLMPDLVVVEMDGDGTPSLLREFERNKVRGHIPVLALVGENKLSESYAYQVVDDFIVSPFDSLELILRAKRLLKRAGKSQSEETIKAGNMTIDLANCEVQIGGRPIDLTFKEYELLKFLAKDRGRVFSRESLLDKIWGYDYFGGDRTVDVHVRRLRAKIETYGDTYIETVRNIGYRFKKKAQA